MEWYCYVKGPCTQILTCADLCSDASVDAITMRLPASIGAVYSDPPWNPGNAQYWRRHAGAALDVDYPMLLTAWHTLVASCCSRGAQHVCCEQSLNRRHRQMFFDAMQGWSLPQQGEYTVYYGSPGSASVRRPNTLLHFGYVPLATNPSAMAGEAMTIRTCAGLGLLPGAWIVDPCIGKGMTSRMAHYFGWNCFGTELNAARLAVTCAWLEKQGYMRDA